jgi:hypothetical protein
MVEAQEQKDAIENRQRADRKLRAAAAARREAGGPKYSYAEYKNHPLCGAT